MAVANDVVTESHIGTTGSASAVSITVTALTDTKAVGVVLQQENQAPAQAAVDDGIPITNSVRYTGAQYGGGGLPGNTFTPKYTEWDV